MNDPGRPRDIRPENFLFGLLFFVPDTWLVVDGFMSDDSATDHISEDFPKMSKAMCQPELPDFSM